MRSIAASRQKWVVKVTKIGSSGALMAEFSASDKFLGDCNECEVTRASKKWSYADDNGEKSAPKISQTESTKFKDVF